MAGGVGMDRYPGAAAGASRDGPPAGRRGLRGLVPNPFYRNAKAPIVDGSFDFSKPEDRAKVMPMAAALTADANISDAKAYTAFLDDQPQTNKKKKVGVQGYCMGGPLTFRTAATRPGRIGAAATFHGGGLVTDKPDSPHLLIPQMKAEVLCCVADNDDKRDPPAKEKLKESFAAAHLKATVECSQAAITGGPCAEVGFTTRSVPSARGQN